MKTKTRIPNEFYLQEFIDYVIRHKTQEDIKKSDLLEIIKDYEAYKTRQISKVELFSRLGTSQVKYLAFEKQYKRLGK